MSLLRKRIIKIIRSAYTIACLETAHATKTRKSDTDEQTPLFGRGTSLDSLAFVSLLVDVEQQVNEQLSILITLADDRALSQKKSPFRTIRSLTDYICMLIQEQGQCDKT